MRLRTKRFIGKVGTMLFLALLSLLAACASSSVQTTTASNGKSTHSTNDQQHAKGTTQPLTHIRMVDQRNGWALTKDAILRTTDGGQHWKDVTIRGMAGSAMDNGAYAQPVFQSAARAWVFVPAPATSGLRIIIWRTSDAGQNWQRYTFEDPQAFYLADRPQFSDELHGWLLLRGSSGAGSQGVDLYKTTDGGQTWTIAAKAPGALPLTGQKSAPTFANPQTGWLPDNVGAMSDTPQLYYTHDSGHTWNNYRLQTIPGVQNAYYEMTPPVIFDRAGSKMVIPAHIHTDSGSILAIYAVARSGKWAVYTTKAFDTDNLYVISMNHFWALDKGALYATDDVGQHWVKLANLPATAASMSFIDARQGWIIDSSSPVIYHTIDGGLNWRKITYAMQQ